MNAAGAGFDLTSPRRPAALGGLGLGLGLTCLVAMGVGSMGIPVADVLAILLSRLGIATGEVDPTLDAVLWMVRLPRVLLGACAGAALGVAGALTQGLFRNPLADPGLIGVSSGAALAAASSIAFAPQLFGMGAGLEVIALPVMAFVGGAAATVLVWWLASREGTASVIGLLLAGVAVNALCAAGIGLVVFSASDAQVVSITFWTLGSVGGATLERVAIALPLVLLPTLLALRFAGPLDALLLGEAEAGHLGVDVRQLKRGVVAVAALLVGATVAFCGIIGFVGLAVPHLVRLAWGPGHRLLLPASGLLGATLLVAADAACRTLVAPSELPIGILTTMVGAPLFLWLLRREVMA